MSRQTAPLKRHVTGLWVGSRAISAHAGTPLDTQTRYVRNFLGFPGLDDVEFVYAEGLAMGEADRAGALQAADEAIAALCV